jgi:ubiquinone biosynthesis protein UbiJ
MQPKDIIAALLERAVNAYLQVDPEAAGRLRAVSGKRIALELHGIDVMLLVWPHEDRIQITTYVDAEPDVVISGSLLSLARLARSSNAIGAIAGEDVQIRGDAEVARLFHEALAAVEIDWEEWLAARVGDVPAHQMGNVFRGLTAGLSGSIDRLRMDVSEYLQEETRIVPTRVEIEQFIDAVDLLRVDVDRIEARLERLVAASSQIEPPHSDNG